MASSWFSVEFFFFSEWDGLFLTKLLNQSFIQKERQSTFINKAIGISANCRYSKTKKGREVEFMKPSFYSSDIISSLGFFPSLLPWNTLLVIVGKKNYFNRCNVTSIFISFHLDEITIKSICTICLQVSSGILTVTHTPEMLYFSYYTFKNIVPLQPFYNGFSEEGYR